MDDGSKPRARTARWAAVAALLVAGAVGGGVLAGTLSASASNNNAASSTYAANGDALPAGHGGAQPMRSDEKSVSSADAATLRASALKAVPGGSVYRIETDAGDGTYEAHLQKADGTLVTVKFDKNLKVTKVEAGMGAGEPAPTR